MNTKTKFFLRKKFKSYYWKNRVEAPPEIEKREFGVGTLEKKINIRHKSFRNEKRLNDYLKREAPFYISYSNAYYEFPENQPMETKNWLGADLIFDLDVEMSHLNHDKLENVKHETLNLMDFLIRDFGFKKNEIRINFSGNKGYHLHIPNDSVRELNGDQRREIVDYVTGTGLNLNHFIKYEQSTEGIVYGRGGPRKYSSSRVGPKKDDAGWSGRIYSAVVDLIKKSDMAELKKEGIGEGTARKIIQNREKIIKALESGRWEGVEGVRGKTFQKIIEKQAVKLTGDADKMVTIDTSRLIRLPDTLHGGSGLKAATVKNFERFDPLTDAIAFGDEKTRISITKNVPGFDINGKSFGPYKKSEVDVPEYAAIYLLLKDVGELG